MKINLRNAAIVQEQIKKALAEVERSLTVTVEVPITAGDTVAALAETASTKFFTNLTSAQNLRQILYGIRKAIGRQNSVSGIDDLITDRVNLKEQIAQLSKFKGANVFDASATQRTLDLQLTKMKSGSGYYNDDVSIIAITTEQLTTIKQELVQFERLLRGINDRILALNVNTLIELADDDYAYLEAQGIV